MVVLSRSRTATARLVLAAAVAFGAGCLPAIAQTLDNAPFDPGVQTDEDMPRMDLQNVQPARMQLLGAIQQLRNDQRDGNQSAIPDDQMAVIDARKAMIEAQILADQTRMPQSPADVQAMMQARDEVLRAEEAVGEAQRKLIDDKKVNNTGALREDVALVHAAQRQSQTARKQLAGVRAQIRGLMPPADLE